MLAFFSSVWCSHIVSNTFAFLSGMFHSDLYNDDNSVVAEAIRRLPEHVFEARVHRLHRAMQLSRNKIVLPESMWPKEEDVSWSVSLFEVDRAL